MILAFFSVSNSFSDFHRRPFLRAVSSELKRRGHSAIYFHKPRSIFSLLKKNRQEKRVIDGILVSPIYTLLPVTVCYKSRFLMFAFVSWPIKLQVSLKLKSSEDKRLWFYKPDQYLYLKNLGIKFAYTHYDNYEDDPEYLFSKCASYKKTLEKCIQESEVTFATSTKLVEKLSFPEKVRYMSNAIDRSFVKNESIEPRKNKVIGYVGSIDETLDDSLIGLICERFPDYNVQLIGQVKNEKILEMANGYENIELVGRIAYSDLINYLPFFSIGICPYAASDFNKYRNPLKLVEYFAFGLPSVCTRCDFDSEGTKYTYMADDYEDFIQGIEIMISRDNPCVRRERVAYAAKNTWENRSLFALNELGL